MNTKVVTRWSVPAAAAVLSACGGNDRLPDPPAQPAPAPPVALTCDDSIKTTFKPDTNTNVVLVKAFKQGDPLALSGTPATPPPPLAPQDLCLVKMVIGPGNSGTAGAPSTSAGIGIEVWLPTPAAWNERIRNLGGGGWAGGNQSSTTLIGNAGAALSTATGYVVGTTDTGHTVGSGAFAMREDGGINSTLWKDFADRSLNELAVKTKALVQAYYLKTQKFAYWEGCSTGGRQGYKMAQEHPEHYDGYLNGAPAFNWTRFITNELYPQVVMQRDLGASMAPDKINFVSAAAVSACDVVGGQHLGFILDTASCRYDPLKDASVLCTGVQGDGVVGTSTNAACVSAPEARAINKIWYGQTADGTVPDPQLDNGSAPTLASGANQLWWGLERGTNLLLLAGPSAGPPFFGPFPISSDMVALEMQNASFATPGFTNALGNGANRWRDLTYVDLAYAYDQGVALQPFFGGINTDNPDLSKARDRKAKILSYHGLADQLITPDGSVNYFTRLSNSVGGHVEAQKFDRLYLIPGMGHCAGIGTVNGSASPPATPNSVPLPAPGQFFNALVSWVEAGTVPAAVTLSSTDGSVSMPVCPYPQKATYNGTGSVTAAASYSCK